MIKIDGADLTVALASEVEARQGDPDFMLSLGRGLAVLGAFGTAKRALTVSEISRMTGIPHQAVRRCLHTYCELGFLGSSGNGFTPRPRLLSLGYVFFTALPFTAIARPVLDKLHQEFDLAFSIGVFDGDEVTYAVRTGGGRQYDQENQSHLATGVPDRRPAYCTAPGRVLLTTLDPGALDSYLQRTDLKPWTERTVTSPHLLRAIVQHVAETGHAVVDQEVSMGLRSIAIPIRDGTGQITGALGSLAVAAQWSVAELEDRVLPALKTAVRGLSLNW